MASQDRNLGLFSRVVINEEEFFAKGRAVCFL